VASRSSGQSARLVGVRAPVPQQQSVVDHQRGSAMVATAGTLMSGR
jgi:hypothetical protein